jgi:hypothetical protein
MAAQLVASRVVLSSTELVATGSTTKVRVLGCVGSVLYSTILK